MLDNIQIKLTWNPETRTYDDETGNPIIDEFGNRVKYNKVLVCIGQEHNRGYVLFDYYGKPYINKRFLEALTTALNKKYNGNGWKTFDYIEIIERFTDATSL